MGEIIHFPNAVQASRGDLAMRPAVTTVKDVNNQIHLGPWHFTCQKCQAKTTFTSENMIFRSVDFYCASCGALHRVTNPAFTSPVPKK
jgi:late competence protein required for DNA uptake (superfamily II DNA/RNA helicase)